MEAARICLRRHAGINAGKASHAGWRALRYGTIIKYGERMIGMETKDVVLALRTKSGLSQEELAEKIYVTRQAVSRWENGETVPNTEALKQLSRLFDVSINTLLGSPRKLVCQCCGMPLEDSFLSREPDGTLNEEYCKWCYADGKFVYTNLEQLTDFLVDHMSNAEWPAEQARAYFQAMLPKLKHWQDLAGGQ